jgi:hypothetical protein
MGPAGAPGRDAILLVRSDTLFEPSGRISGFVDYYSDGTIRTLTVRRNDDGRPVALD